MKLNRKDFLNTLKQAEPALSTQDFIPILNHFCFDGEYLTTFNDIQSIRVKCPTDFVGGLPGQTLIKILGSYSSEFIELKYTSEKEVTVKSGRSNIRMPLLSESQFLFKPQPLDNIPKIKLDWTFYSGLSKCLISVGSDPTHPEQTGVTMQISNKTLKLFSTDNQTISKCETTCQVTEDCPSQIVLPAPFCTSLIAFVKTQKNSDIFLYLGEGFVVAEIDKDVTLFSKIVLAEDYIPFEEKMAGHKAKDGIKPQEIPEEFIAALERSLILLSKSIDKKTTVTVEKNSMLMLTETPEGESSDVVEFDNPVSTKKFSFKMDPSLIKRAIPLTSEIMFLTRTVFLYDKNYTYVSAHYSEK